MAHNKIKILQLGQVVMTRGVNDLIEKATILNEQLFEILQRHAWGDWGKVSVLDRIENENALKNGCRILSSYEINEIRLWIITEADRSVTTILKPEEY